MKSVLSEMKMMALISRSKSDGMSGGCLDFRQVRMPAIDRLALL